MRPVLLLAFALVPLLLGSRGRADELRELHARSGEYDRALRGAAPLEKALATCGRAGRTLALRYTLRRDGTLGLACRVLQGGKAALLTLDPRTARIAATVPIADLATSRQVEADRAVLARSTATLTAVLAEHLAREKGHRPVSLRLKLHDGRAAVAIVSFFRVGKELRTTSSTRMLERYP